MSTTGHAFHRRRLAHDGPVHVVWGDRDRIVPIAHLEGVMTALPQARQHVWKGMGHHHKQERPAELSELLKRACDAIRLGQPVAQQAA